MTEARKLITCFLPLGRGIDLVERLWREQGILSATVNAGRGRGASAKTRLGLWDEIDILTVTVPAGRADEVFAFIYQAGDLDRPRGGIVFQHALDRATRFELPEC